MGFLDRLVRNIESQGAAAFAENLAGGAGCGAPGADSGSAFALAQDLRRGIKALCSWVSSLF